MWVDLSSNPKVCQWRTVPKILCYSFTSWPHITVSKGWMLGNELYYLKHHQYAVETELGLVRGQESLTPSIKRMVGLHSLDGILSIIRERSSSFLHPVHRLLWRKSHRVVKKWLLYIYLDYFYSLTKLRNFSHWSILFYVICDHIAERIWISSGHFLQRYVWLSMVNGCILK